MASVLLVVGSVYGNSSSVAEECAELLRSAGHEADILSNASLNDLKVRPDSVLLVCTSTTGQGEIPDNLYPLVNELRESFPLMPDRRYGVIALGDSSYETFADAGRQVDELLQELQGKRIGEVLYIDACETADPEGTAVEWMREWMKAL